MCCCICRRIIWSWMKCIVWYGEVSNCEIVIVHKWCGINAAAEFIRGMNM